MYDCWVERDRLRIVMSSIMRRRRGLIVAIGDSCREGGGCDDPHPLRQETLDQQPSAAARAATPAQRVRSMRIMSVPSQPTRLSSWASSYDWIGMNVGPPHDETLPSGCLQSSRVDALFRQNSSHTIIQL